MAVKKKKNYNNKSNGKKNRLNESVNNNEKTTLNKNIVSNQGNNLEKNIDRDFEKKKEKIIDAKENLEKDETISSDVEKNIEKNNVVDKDNTNFEENIDAEKNICVEEDKDGVIDNNNDVVNNNDVDGKDINIDDDKHIDNGNSNIEFEKKTVVSSNDINDDDTDSVGNDVDKEDNENIVVEDKDSASDTDNLRTDKKSNDTDISDDVDNVKNRKDYALKEETNDVKESQDKIILDEESIESDKLLNNDKKAWKYTIIFLIIFVFSVIFLIFPRIKLLGEEKIVISYKDSYVEKGYKFNVFGKDLSDRISISSNLEDGVTGEYLIEYYASIFGIRFKKTRIISIVDKDAPYIEVENKIINVCPNQEIPEFIYKGIDEYDGDITLNVKKEIFEDKVLLSVSDSSKNMTELSIDIKRGDNISPVIELKGQATMYLDYGSKYVEPGYRVSDNCSNDLFDKVVIKGSVGRDIGTYNLVYEVVDDNGNKSSISRMVIVRAKINDNGTINTGSIYLTFDDGPNQGTTNRILDILKEENVKATFFVTCNGPDYLIKRMYDEGHMVALHTATHNYSYIYSSTDNYFNDLYSVRDRVKRITGTNSMIIRFPGGSSNTISRNYKTGIMTELSYLALDKGYRYFDWNVDAMDASSARSSSDVYYNVTSKLSMNRANVVLMHDTKNITADAIRDIIRFGKDNNYQFRAIDMNTYMVRHGINN